MITCEMFVSDFFKLTIGHIALVGRIVPDIEEFISNSKTDLYIGGHKIKSINIIGEDRFSGGDIEKRKKLRSIRIDDDIVNELNTKGDKEVILIIYLNR